MRYNQLQQRDEHDRLGMFIDNGKPDWRSATGQHAGGLMMERVLRCHIRSSVSAVARECNTPRQTVLRIKAAHLKFAGASWAVNGVVEFNYYVGSSIL